MSYRGASQLLSFDRLDVSLAKIGLLVSVLLLGLRLYAAQVFLVVIPLAAGIGSLLYLLLRRREEPGAYAERAGRSSGSFEVLPRVVFGYLPGIAVLGLAGLVVLIQVIGTRTTPVYLLTGAVGAAVFAQILFVGRDRISPALVLAQIFAVAIVLRLTALYATPGYVGVDIWTHATVFVDGITRSGSLSALSESKYLLAPFYHAIGAVGAVVFGGTRNGIYLSLGVFVPLSALFVYTTGKLLVPTRWALLGTAFYAFSDQFIRWGMHIIPTSLGLAFFLGAVYAVTRILHADAEPWSIGLLGLSSLAVVFTHQIATAITLVLLGIAALVATATTALGIGAARSHGGRNALALWGVFAVTLVTTITTWSRAPFSGGGTFLSTEMAVLSEAIRSVGFLDLASTSSEAAGTLGGGETGTSLAELTPYVELFGFTLLLLATVVGGLYLLRQGDIPSVAATHLLLGGTLFVMVFGLSLFGFRALLPGRWIAFLHVSMAILGAVGLYYVSRMSSRRVVVALFILVALGYPGTMVVAEKATLDAPAFDDQHKQFAYTEAEIAAVETISGAQPTGSTTIATDHPYVTLFRGMGGYGFGASVLEFGDDGPAGVDAAVYREHQSSGPVTFRSSPESGITELPADLEGSVCPAGWNSAYANDEVKLCTPVASGGGR